MACSLTYVLTSLSGDCTNSNLGGFSIDIYGDAPDYTIQWINPSLGTIPLGVGVTGYTATTLSAGTYSFNINDSCLPTNTSLPVNINISSGTCVSIIGQQNTTCNFENGALTAQTSSFYGSADFYLYNTLTGFITSATTGYNTFEVPPILSPGIYYVVADDGGGCTGMSETVIIKSSSTISWGFYIVEDSGCNNVESGKIYITGLTGNPPFTYLWSNGETTDFITGLTNGTYSVTITDNTNCALSQSATVGLVPSLGIAGILTTTPPSCFSSDGEVTVTISGGTGPYYYSASTGQINVSFSSSQTFQNIGSGLFSVKVTDAALCSVTGSISVLTPNGFSIVTINTINANCGNNGKIEITLLGGQPPFTYILVNSNGDTQTQVTNSSVWQFVNLAADTYTLTISDNGACVYTNTYTIATTSPFTLSASTTGTTCNLQNGSVEISISGGTPPYTVNIGSELQIIQTSATTFSNLFSGVYAAEIDDSVPGCAQIINFVIDTSEDVDFLLQGTNANNGNDGTLSAYITSGTPPFTLLWSNNVNGQTGYYLSNLSAGTYSLQVTDNNGCVKTRRVTIDGFDLISSFQTFNVCDSDFENIGELVKKGPKEMLNEGYYDLTSGYTNCILNQATFNIVATIGEITNISQFYISTALNDFPTDEEYFDALVTLLETFDQVAQVNIDPLNNGIQIIAKCEEQYLVATDVSVDMFIEYNISCQYCGLPPTLTPTQTPTQTITPTITPTNTATPTNTPTPGQSPSPTPTQTQTPTPTQTVTPTVTRTPTPTPTLTPTPTSSSKPLWYLYKSCLTPKKCNTYRSAPYDEFFNIKYIDCDGVEETYSDICDSVTCTYEVCAQSIISSSENMNNIGLCNVSTSNISTSNTSILQPILVLPGLEIGDVFVFNTVNGEKECWSLINIYNGLPTPIPSDTLTYNTNYFTSVSNTIYPFNDGRECAECQEGITITELQQNYLLLGPYESDTLACIDANKNESGGLGFTTFSTNAPEIGSQVYTTPIFGTKELVTTPGWYAYTAGFIGAGIYNTIYINNTGTITQMGKNCLNVLV